jgi:arylformamidase
VTPDEREREYSPSSCIGGDYQPFIAAYEAQSLEARRLTESRGARWHELRYGDAPAQRIDLCLPAQASPMQRVPLLVFIHGGYWQELSARDSLFAAAGCVEAGLAFAAIDYTLAPQAGVPQIVRECGAAIEALAACGPSLGFDPRHIVVAGSSAGAHLAAMAALPGAVQAPLRGVVLVSGIYDLRPLVGTSINDALGLDEATARQVSPALHSVRGFPRTVVAWGAVETREFKRQSREFAAQLQKEGTACETVEIPARNHFDVILDLANPGTLLGARTLALLQLA